MSNLYLVPNAFDSSGKWSVEYAETDLAGKSFVCMPMGLEGLALVATDLNAALSAESDVFTIGSLNAVITSEDVSSLQSYLSQFNIPNSFITAGTSWRQTVRVLAQIAQVFQRHVGITGSAILSGNSTASLQQQGQALKSGGQSGVQTKTQQTIQPPVILPTLDTAISSMPDVQSNLADVAASFKFSMPEDDSLEDVLLSLAAQFTNPLVMSRGDGFTI